MKKIIVGTLALVALTANTFAGCNAKQCSGKVDRLYMTAGGSLYVSTDGNEASLNCTNRAGKYMTLAANDKGKNAMYSLLLTAKTTKSNVTIRVKEGSNTCQILYVTN